MGLKSASAQPMFKMTSYLDVGKIHDDIPKSPSL